METIIFILGVIGITQIIVESDIIKPIRDWFAIYPKVNSFRDNFYNIYLFFRNFKFIELKTSITQFVSKLIHCPQCTGFWVGLILGIKLKDFDFLFLITCGGAGSFLSNFATVIMTYFDAQTIISINDSEL